MKVILQLQSLSSRARKIVPRPCRFMQTLQIRARVTMDLVPYQLRWPMTQM